MEKAREELGLKQRKEWLLVLSPGGGAAAAGTLSGSEPELAAVRLRERQGCD